VSKLNIRIDESRQPEVRFAELITYIWHFKKCADYNHASIEVITSEHIEFRIWFCWNGSAVALGKVYTDDKISAAQLASDIDAFIRNKSLQASISGPRKK
jgi:hypothetical protein